MPHDGASLASQLRQNITDTHAPPVRAVGAANAIAAHVAAEAGFDALWVSSLEVSAAAGLPDANVIGVHELTAAIGAARRCVSLPVVVDVDNGGGSVAAAGHYAHDLAQAGVAALCLEDSAYPKCNSFSSHRRQLLADADLTADQLRRMRAQSGEPMVLIARTEALIAGKTIDEALARAARYADAGADAVVIHSKDCTGTEALDVARAWQDPAALVTIPTAFPHLRWQELGSVGYRMCIYANQLTRAALAGMRAAATEFAGTGTLTGGRDPLPSIDEVLSICDGDGPARVELGR